MYNCHCYAHKQRQDKHVVSDGVQRHLQGHSSELSGYLGAARVHNTASLRPTPTSFVTNMWRRSFIPLQPPLVFHRSSSVCRLRFPFGQTLKCSFTLTSETTGSFLYINPWTYSSTASLDSISFNLFGAQTNSSSVRVGCFLLSVQQMESSHCPYFPFSSRRRRRRHL